MQNLAEFMPWKNCWPVSGPDMERRLLLSTFGPASHQAWRWASLSKPLQARERRPKPPRMCSRAGVRVFLGLTNIR